MHKFCITTVIVFCLVSDVHLKKNKINLENNRNEISQPVTLEFKGNQTLETKYLQERRQHTDWIYYDPSGAPNDSIAMDFFTTERYILREPCQPLPDKQPKQRPIHTLIQYVKFYPKRPMIYFAILLLLCPFCITCCCGKRYRCANELNPSMGYCMTCIHITCCMCCLRDYFHRFKCAPNDGNADSPIKSGSSDEINNV